MIWSNKTVFMKVFVLQRTQSPLYAPSFSEQPSEYWMRLKWNKKSCWGFFLWWIPFIFYCFFTLFSPSSYIWFSLWISWSSCVYTQTARFHSPCFTLTNFALFQTHTPTHTLSLSHTQAHTIITFQLSLWVCSGINEDLTWGNSLFET